MEEFKKCLPERIVVSLNEQKVETLSKAAVCADEFVLTHRAVFPSVLHEYFLVKTQEFMPTLPCTKVKVLQIESVFTAMSQDISLPSVLLSGAKMVRTQNDPKVLV